MREKMTEVKANNSPYIVFKNIIIKGLFANKFARVYFLVIFIALFYSCIFECDADSQISLIVSKTKADKLERSLISTYIRQYIMHLSLGWLHNYLFFCNSEFFKSIICQYLLKSYLSLDFDEYSRIGAGKVHSNIQKRSDSAVFLLHNLCLGLFYSVFYIILFFKNLFGSKYADVPLGIKLIFPSIFIAFLIMIFLCCKISFTKKTKLVASEHLNSLTLYDILKNFSIIKSFNKESFEINRYLKHLKPHIKLGFQYYHFDTFSNIFIKLLFFSSVIFSLYFKNIFTTGVDKNNLFPVYFSILLSFKRHINSIKDSIFKISDKLVETVTCDVVKEKHRSKTEQIIGETTSISFENTSVSYESQKVFDGLNLNIQQGDKIAITGRNGAGKSTIIKAVMGMQSYEGKIILNGKGISSIQEENLRKYFSYVPQEPHLFNMTVMENLKYGNERVSDEHVIAKCQECGIHEVFKKLGNGYQTIVGENCSNISGGQAQMINFMRAYIKDSPIFLLDEPTSNLDFATSKKLLSMIKELLKTKTVFMTTHNPDHFKHFDKIVNVSDKKAHVFNTPEEFVNDPTFEFRI